MQVTQLGNPEPQETRRAVFAARSLLFVPADSERKIAKGLASGADVIILDLEDSVAAEGKDAARALVCEVLRAERSVPVMVRIYAADTPWYLADVAAIGGLGPDAVMLPKCANATDVRRLADQLAVLEVAAGRTDGGAAILPLVTETAATASAMDYRGGGARLCGLGFAGEDLASDLGVAARGNGSMNPLLAHARRAVAFAAAAAGVGAIDTPFPDPRDPDGLAREAGEATAMGFAGKMCIHPGQIEAVHAAFTPAPERLDRARAVVAAFAAAPGAGVTVLDGRMIDRPHLRLAERIVAQAAVIDAG